MTSFARCPHCKRMLIAGQTCPDKGDIWHTHSASILSAIAEPGQAQDAVLTALVEGGRLTFEVKWDPCSAAEHGHEDFEVCFHASDIRSRLIEPEWRQDAP